jgi:8-oxo-dGTP pyrophosphatase MutT (NUDIX family)
MLVLVGAAGDSFSRAHYSPGHFTCSSFVVSPDRQSLLLIYHSKLNRWLQPGGHIEPDDVDVFAAARREVHEETGIESMELLDGPCLFDLDIHSIPSFGDTSAHQHFDLRFLFQAPSTEAKAGSDAVDARWVRYGAVNDMESDISVMRAVSKLVDRFGT